MADAQRMIAEFSHDVKASPEKIFPLLCPIRELDWIPGWNCELIYSDSGFAENNCIFTTEFPDRGKGTYVISAYDPKQFIIQFVIFFPGFLVEKLDISIHQKEDSLSVVHWRRTYTGLNDAGNRWVKHFVANMFQQRMQMIADAMSDYLR